MPYNDMIRCSLENTDVQTGSIINHQKVVVGPFRPEHLQVMYKLSPNPKYIYNVAFVMDFEQNECLQFERSYPDIVKCWWRYLVKFRADSHKVYSTTSLNAYMIYVAMMLCRIFRKKTPTHFSVE
jgi:hypothetical protein